MKIPFAKFKLNFTQALVWHVILLSAAALVVLSGVAHYLLFRGATAERQLEPTGRKVALNRKLLEETVREYKDREVTHRALMSAPPAAVDPD